VSPALGADTVISSAEADQQSDNAPLLAESACPRLPSKLEEAREIRRGRAFTVPQVSAVEFEGLPLRVHKFLAGVPLHDVWAINLPHTRSGITLDDFIAATRHSSPEASPVVRMLLGIRFFVGRVFGWDREPAAAASETFSTRLTAADRSKSLAPAGTRDGLFCVVYRFENEQLLELANRTAHAAAVSALVETADSYRFYFGVYVRNISRFTPFYMAAIDPFRRLIVYPSLLRSVRATWGRAFGA
jgi:hypothetical protein